MEGANASKISSEERAKATIVAVNDERKVSNSLIASLQDQLSALEEFVIERRHGLLGECTFFVLSVSGGGVVVLPTSTPWRSPHSACLETWGKEDGWQVRVYTTYPV